MIIDCISDLHGRFPQLEGGDLLIVAGDLTANDSDCEIDKATEWLQRQPYKKKIIVAGNHDNWIMEGYHSGPWENWNGNVFADYLCDSGTEFGGMKIWGSPYTLRFDGENPKALAFTCETEEDLAEHWAMIPENIDILVTHSPIYGVLDDTENEMNVGSESLIKPLVHSNCRLHVCGHIHEAYGKYKNPINGITYVNASHVNKRYEAVNKPVRVELL